MRPEGKIKVNLKNIKRIRKSQSFDLWKIQRKKGYDTIFISNKDVKRIYELRKKLKYYKFTISYGCFTGAYRGK